MPYFRRRSVAVEAVRFLDTNASLAEVRDFVSPQDLVINMYGVHLRTRRGLIQLEPGDYVVRDGDAFYRMFGATFCQEFVEVEHD